MNARTLHIDGSLGEGGGQVLRTSLALAAATGRSVVIDHVRAGRAKPGLQLQHLAAVKAVAKICDGDVRGAERGSRRVELRPGQVSHGDRVFRIGSAGSAVLVAHAVLPALLVAPGRSRFVVEGGTHNPMAPVFEHFERALVPALTAMGARVSVTLDEPGFVPEGGGRLIVDVEGGAVLTADAFARIVAAPITVQDIVVWLGGNLDEGIAEREVAAALAGFAGAADGCAVSTKRCRHVGNAVAAIFHDSEGHTDVVSALGARGRSAAVVAAELVAEGRAYVDAGVPVGPHLADQLLLPLALGCVNGGRGGSFLTTAPTLHATTNAAVIQQFLDVDIRFDDVDGGCLVTVAA